ncbi:uncharacterized protein AC631_03909 [Debaryomyces fabryi]|uniref:Rrp15p-domain-containing protein n=1 Tax=Debaryomyces fabryi TaxID=58627 RepID=A0A0V1PVQ6_9ASCO|nr:uncharacterized protein AC631_03909 [Debaryomyces fabryi]KSA00344.1 hypothetical protein AC631_03909 [Debaryomyces fabryi]CUM49295.1 unnamed protein product [Debaryomyces fabryi]
MGAAAKKQRIGIRGDAKVTKKLEKKDQVRSSDEENESVESSDEENENLEDIEGDDEVDIEVDDEADIDGVSSGDEAEDSEENTDSSDYDDDEIPKMKKKKNLDDGSESFANAFNAIVGSRLKAYNRKDPILAKNKTTLKKLESDKLEAKAKRLILSEKKQLHDKHRIKNLLPSASEPEKVRTIIQNERQLKKVAQKGVVRLFNAVLSTQLKTNQEIGKEQVGQTKKEELMNEISKEKFLDLVQAAGQS